MSSTPNRTVKRPGVTPRRTPSRPTPVAQRTTPLRQRQLNAPINPHPSPKPIGASHHDQGEEGIQVVIRMRPLNTTEQSHRRIWKVLPKYSSIAQTSADGQPLPDRTMGRTFFTFDKTFGEETTTRQVYDGSARNIVKSVCTGLNGTIFAYGQTSSGKTFTMQGSGTIQQGSAAASGIIHMAAQEIFDHITENQDRIYLVRASFLEIYNEDVRDLLNSDNSKSLQIREDPTRGVFVQCKEETVKECQTLLGVLAKGEKSRAFAATAMNERSSRSHTIFRVTIESRQKRSGEEEEEEGSAVLVSTLNLVDLAGSESVRHTGATGERQKEGGMINTSLLTLSRVMNALGTNTPHINFRDSKLTRILQPSLSGNARMAVICCATSSELYLEETRSTLQFASRAKLVKTRAQVNEILDERSQIRRLEKELAEARRELRNSSGAGNFRELEQKVATSSQEANNYKEKLNRLKSSILNGNNGLFGEKDVPLQKTLPNKRRLSDGGMLLGRPNTSVLKVRAPETLPRPDKRLKIEPADSPPPSLQLKIFQEALSSKSQALKDKLVTLDELESKLESSQLRTDQLQAQLDETNKAGLGLSAERDSLSEDLTKALEEKHAAFSQLEDMESKMVTESQCRRALEASIGGLQKDKLALEQEYAQMAATLEEESQRFGLEKVQLEERLESLLQSKYAVEQVVQSLETQLATVKSNLEALQITHSELDEDKIRLSSELDHLNSQNATLHQELAQLMVTLEQHTTSFGSEKLQLEEQLESISQSKREVEHAVEVLEEELAILRSNHERLQTQHTEQEEDKVRLLSQMDELNTQHAALGEDHALLKETLLQETRLFVSEKSQLEQQLEIISQSKYSVEQEVLSLEAQLGTLTSNYEALQTAHAVLEEDKSTLSSQLNQLSTQHAALEQEQLGLKETLDQQTSRFGSETLELVEQLESLTQSMNAREQALQSVEARLETLTSSHDQHQTARIALEAEKVRLSSQLDQLNAQYAAVEHDRDVVRDRMGSMDDHVQVLSVSLRREQSEKESALAEILRLSAINRDLVESLQQSRAENENMSNSLNQVSIDRDAAAVRMQELECDFSARIQELEGDLSARDSTLAAQCTELETSKLHLGEALRELEHTKSCFATAQVELEIALKDKSDMQLVHENLKERVVSADELLAQVRAEYSGSLASTRETLECTTQEMHEKQLCLERLTEQNCSLRSERDVLNGELQNYQRSLESIKDKLSCTQAEKQEAQQSLNEHQQQILTLRSRLDEVSNSYDSCLTDLESTRTEVETLKKQKTSIEVTLQDAREKNKDLTVMIERLQGEREISAKEHIRLQSENGKLYEDFHASEAARAAIQDELEMSSKELHRVTGANVELQSHLAGLAQELGEVQQKYQTLNFDKESISSELAASMRSISLLESQLVELREERHKDLECWESTKASLEKAQQHINRLESIKSTNAENIKSLEDVSKRLQAEITTLEVRNAALEELIEKKDANIQELSTSITALQDNTASLLHDLDRREAEADDLNEELKRFKSDLASTRDEKNDVTRELLSSHDMLESRNSQLTVAQKKINELEDQLCSMRKMLNEQSIRVAQLEDAISNANVELQEHDGSARIKPLEEKIESLNQECFEVKKLLSGANGIIAAAREKEVNYQEQLDELLRQLQQSRQQLSQLEVALEAAESSQRASRCPELATLVAEKLELESRLQNEMADRAKAESELLRRMGDEQRSLVQEAESTMKNLHSELFSTRDRLEKSEAESYAARQHNQELRDDIRAALQKVGQLEKANNRLKMQVEQTHDKESSQVTKLASELHALKAAEYNARQVILDLEDKLRESTNANQNAMCESTRLRETIDSLRRELADSKGKDKESAYIEQSSAVVNLTDQLRQKDERIKKLEKMKFTKAQAEQLKKLKDTNKSLEKQVLHLRKQLEAVTSAAGESSDITKLQFDKEALESKLRKAAMHSQALEAEKDTCLKVLRNNQQHIDDGDLVKAVVSLCDRFTSDSKKRGSSLSDLERLSADQMSLQSTVLEQKRKLALLQERVTSLQLEKEEMGRVIAQGHDAVALQRKVSRLEQENLTFLTDHKELKKKYHAATKELNLLRLKGSDDITMEIQQLKKQQSSSARKHAELNQGGLQSASSSKRVKLPGGRSSVKEKDTVGAGRHITNNENVDNRPSFVLDNLSTSVLQEHRKTPQENRKTPGLGESHPDTGGDSNTPECTQS